MFTPDPISHSKLLERITRLDERFEHVDDRFEAMDKRFEAMQITLQQIGKRVGSVQWTVLAGLAAVAVGAALLVGFLS